jgi:hypothetical protein
MSNSSRWRGLYTSTPNGRCRMTHPALLVFESKYAHRVVQAHLRGWGEKIVLLDRPFLVGPKIHGAENVDEHDLRRIRLGDLPGWPPRLPPRTPPPAFSLLECRLGGVEFKRRRSAALPRVELDLGHRERRLKALIIGPPILLLKCVEATLLQEGAAGKKLSDLQELRLLGPE